MLRVICIKIRISFHLMGHPDLISIASGGGPRGFGFSLVGARAGLDRVGKTSHDFAVVVGVLSSTESGEAATRSDDDKGDGDVVYRWDLKLGGSNPVKSSNTATSSNVSMSLFSFSVVEDVVDVNVVTVVVAFDAESLAAGNLKPGGRRADKSSNLWISVSIGGGGSDDVGDVDVVIVVVSVAGGGGGGGSGGSGVGRENPGGNRALTSSITDLLKRRSNKDKVLVCTALGVVTAASVVLEDVLMTMGAEVGEGEGAGVVSSVVVVVDAVGRDTGRCGGRKSKGCRGRSNVRIGVKLEGGRGELLTSSTDVSMWKLLARCLLDNSDWKRSSSSMLLSTASAGGLSSNKTASLSVGFLEAFNLGLDSTTRCPMTGPASMDLLCRSAREVCAD